MALDYNSWDVKEGVLLGLLNSSEEMFFPTIPNFIFSEVANGVIDFVGGKAGEITYAKRNLITNDFEKDLWEHYQQETKKSDKLLPDLKLVLDAMLEPTWDSAPPPDNGGEYQTDLYLLFKPPTGGGICREYMISTFSLPHNFEIGGNEFMVNLEDETKQSIQQIGKKMRPFIQEDIAYIKEKYHW